jgi:hypothetical protein
MTAHRDAKSGRFARRPVSGVDAESAFDPMGDDIPFEDASGSASPNTTERPRYSPAGDTLAGIGPGYGSPRLAPRRAVLVAMDQEARTAYGQQGGRLRDAARLSGAPGALGYVLGIDPGPGTDGKDTSDGE